MADESEARLQSELTQLLADIRRIGPTYPAPVSKCLFSELFDDPAAEARGYSESLVGLLKAARRRGLIQYPGAMLMRGMHDRTVLSIVGEMPPPKMRLGPDGSLVAAPGRGGLAGRAGKVDASWMKGGDGRGGSGGRGEGKVLETAPRPPARRWSRPTPPSPTAPSPPPPPPPPPRHGRPALQARALSTPVLNPSASPNAAPAPVASPSYSTQSAGIVFRSTATKSSDVAKEMAERINEEVARLPSDIVRMGAGTEHEGRPTCTFGDLFDDDEVQNYYEAIVGTLKAAKKRGIVSFKGQMLLKGMHDKVIIEALDGPQIAATGTRPRAVLTAAAEPAEVNTAQTEPLGRIQDDGDGVEVIAKDLAVAELVDANGFPAF
jgi:hypothetical protein